MSETPDYSSLIGEGEKFYICTPCVPPQGEGFHHTVATVWAKDEEEAAAEAADWIEQEAGEDLDPDYMNTMFVLEFDPAAWVPMDRSATYDRSDGPQCCGGGCVNGHSGNCRFARDDAEA